MIDPSQASEPEDGRQLVTNYAGHDKAYRIKKAEGHEGWDKSKESYRDRAEAISRLINSGILAKEGKWLELGCGAGNLSIKLAQYGLQLTGVDISPCAIRWARENVNGLDVNARFEVADVLNLETYSDHIFSVILDGHCFHCIIGEDRKTFLKEAHRLLQPDGQLFIDTMVGPVNSCLLDGFDQASQCTVFKNIATRYFATTEQIEAELCAAGFTIKWSDLSRHEIHGLFQIVAEKA